MDAAFRTLGLTKYFRRQPVLDRLDLDVAEGSVFGLVGPNGAGKTTTIKILMNILQPTSGSAHVLGIDSRRLGPADLTRIGYVSENQDMPGWMTVAELLAYLKPFYPTWDTAHAERLVREFDLPPERKLRHLSRGMFMKASLASSLAYRPRLLVLDEPFSGLDPVVREDLIEGLRASAGETTILVSSHDLAEIESFASHIGYLDRGRLQFAEEMTALAARFREIEVTARAAAGTPLPSSWLRLEVNSPLTRFVESRFHPDRTPLEIRRLFGEGTSFTVNTMPLRAIFLTLARGTSKAIKEDTRAASATHL